MQEKTYLEPNHDVNIADFATIFEELNRKNAGAKPVNQDQATEQNQKLYMVAVSAIFFAD